MPATYTYVRQNETTEQGRTISNGRMDEKHEKLLMTLKDKVQSVFMVEGIITPSEGRRISKVPAPKWRLWSLHISFKRKTARNGAGVLNLVVK